MPAKSKSQFRLIQLKRKQFGSPDKTPEKWKWIWEKSYDTMPENLPEQT